MNKLNSKFEQSVALYKKAKQLFPYGTQLFSRTPELVAFGYAPIYFDRMKNAHFWDVDGNEFIDTGSGIGPVILGYAYDKVDNAVKDQIDKGVLGTINNELEIKVAEVIVDMVPSAEMVKFCKGGGDADAIAIRIARGYTGKEKVVFCGYHGWHDWYLAANLVSESSLDQHLIPGLSPKGVPESLSGTSLPFEYNNLDQLEDLLKRNEGEVACIIMEATRFKKPKEGFLEGVRKLADKHKCLLIFDEVITGFRMARGGAQEFYGVTPDLSTFAKAMANGYPLAAVVGRKEIMETQSDNFISSTYWSDTVSLAAGLATLNEIKNEPVIEKINEIGATLISYINQIAVKHNLDVDVLGHGYDFTLNFNYADESPKITTIFLQELAERGVYSNNVFYPCYTHTSEDIEKIKSVVDDVFALLADGINNGKVNELIKAPIRKTGFKRMA